MLSTNDFDFELRREFLGTNSIRRIASGLKAIAAKINKKWRDKRRKLSSYFK